MLTEQQRVLIEKYFSGEPLSLSEQQQFEAWQRDSSAFKKEVSFIHALQTGIRRKQLRVSIKKALKKIWLTKVLAIVGVSLCAAAVGASVWHWWNNETELKHFKMHEYYLEPDLEVFNDNGINLNAVAGEVFLYNSKEPFVAESDQGTLVVLPSDAFVDKDGNEVNEAKVTLREYLSADDVLLAGLSTVSKN